jgi:hypothetical protein
MYIVQTLTPAVKWQTVDSSLELSSDWGDAFRVPQLETEQAELVMAREVRNHIARYNAAVRIMKRLPGGYLKEVS